jgi:nucleotide-binding universal stress UspA family protein
MTTILVGVDTSDRSLDAIAFARQVASTSDATVIVANAFPYDDRPSRMANLGYRQALESDALDTVRRMSAELGDLGGARVRTTVVPRLSPAHALHDVCAAEHPDLLIAGSSHVGTIGRVMPGSTGERLLHGAGCPVAIVPKDYRKTDHGLRRIGVAFDASPESEVALGAAVEVARATGASLAVIRVMDALQYSTPALMGGPGYVRPREDAAKGLRTELDDAVRKLPSDISAEAVFRTGDPAHELAVQTGTLDLLITGSRGYGPPRAVMTGAVTGRLLRNAACPVVVLPRGVESPLADVFATHAEASA